MSVDEKMTAIADKIRSYTQKEDKLTLDAMSTEIDEVNNAGFASGHDTGYSDGLAAGKTVERNYFWQRYQNWGSREYYQYAFFDAYWTDETYNPIYAIKSLNANYVFQSARITDTKVTVDFSGCSGVAYSTFNNCTKLKTVRKLILNEKLSYGGFWTGCGALQNLTIEGSIGESFNISPSPLTKESIESVISALSSNIKGRTVTFKKTAKEAAFTDEEWTALAATKPNWTISLV